MQRYHFGSKTLDTGMRVGALLAALICCAPTALAVETGQLSITAEGVTAARAIFNLHPDENVRNDDYLAMPLVHPDYWHYSLLSETFDDSMLVTQVYRIHTNYYVNARTKHMDAIVKETVAHGVVQVVNLGAGYDSRAYRFRKTMPQVKFFEIELPAMVAEKKRRLKLLFGEVPDYVAFVPIDFNTQTIAGELEKAGFNPNLKTLFIWEGVTYYISSEAVENTIQFIASSAPGSSVVLDYMPQGVIDKDFDNYPDMRYLSFWVKYKGEPFVFGIKEGHYTSYFEQRGLNVLSDMGPKEMETRYLTQSDGKLVGPCASGFRIMHASVPAE
jgi:methyltransferase (TIGR00027 family)